MRRMKALDALFGEQPRQLETGAGTRLLLLDAAPEQTDLLSQDRLHCLDGAGVGGEAAAARRSFRRLSLLLEGAEGERRPGGALGVAAGARVCVAPSGGAQGFDFTGLAGLVAQHGPFDVIAFCADARGADLGPAALAALARVSDRALVLAAGAAEGGPGWGPGVLPVSTGAGEVAPVQLESGLILARAPDGSLGHLPAAEAAVSVVAGLAALWCERLRSQGVEPDGPLLRALLLASAARARATGCPLGAPLSLQKMPWIGTGPARLQGKLLEPTASCVAVPSAAPASPLWFAPDVSVAVECEEPGLVRTRECGDGWTHVAIQGQVGEQISLNVSLAEEQSRCELRWVAMGVQSTARDARPKSAVSQRPLTIVGISASHDASACVLRGGRLQHAIQLERLTRVKHDGRAFLHTREAVDYCLAAAGLRERDVDVFAFNCMPLAPTFTGLSVPTHDAAFDLFDPFAARAVYVSHHLCHAFGAFLGAGFDAATVIVCDGSGGSTVGRPDLILRGTELANYLALPPQGDEQLHVFSAYHFRADGWELVEREHAASFNTLTGHSHLGEMYASASQYVFGDWQESGKLMGLAPYGEPERFGESLLERDTEGRLQFSSNWKNSLRRVIGRGNPLEYKDFAARIQRDLEDALVDRVTRCLARTGERRVAYAGGVALNSVANHRLRVETGAQALYVMPASHDAGISIGAAAAAHQLMAGRLEAAGVSTDAWGYAYQPRDIEHAVRQFQSVLQTSRVGIADVAARLVSGQIVGWFQGASEFGPRALGQRSILASATQRDTWSYINRRIKYREDFRPFAPMVPEELVGEYFELDEPSPFMLRVVRVRERFRARLGAVTHVDGSARVQTVNRDQLPALHALLCEVGQRAGLPILVNTSLNVRGEPLVETPTQAVEMLLATHLDALVFGGALLVEPVPRAEITAATVPSLPPKCRLQSRCERSGRNYTLLAEARGRAGIDLPQWAFELLSGVDGATPLDTLLARVRDPERRKEAQRLVEALIDLRLLLPTRLARPETGVAAIASPTPRALAEVGAQRADACLDPTPLLPGSQRIRASAETAARVEPLLLELGVSRVAELTEYDYLDLPVFSCIRPFVHCDDITCTQGKGLTRPDALASALMETVERYCGWNHEHVSTRLATCDELTRAGEPWLRLEALGGTACPEAQLEWVWARAVLGAPRWVPASSVFAPYHAPSGVAAPFTWCTTGLAAGNSLNEAVAHGLLEVIERNALSRYIDGAPAQLLHLDSVPAGPERELLERFRAARCELFVLDLSELAPVPTYSLAVFDPAGPEPRIPLAGQGSSLSARGALRRAALEAAQSRVVAIQGSREDLVRHGSQWLEDPAARIGHWEASRKAALRGGTSQFPDAEPTPPRTVGELLSTLADRLAAAGYTEALYVDLTHPALDIPVVSVLIPGMYDSHADPLRRRHQPTWGLVS